jgi:hypothetical protein
MPERSHYILPDGSKFRLSDDFNKIYEFFEKYNFINYEDYEQKLCGQLFDRIKEIFIRYENKGIIPLIFNWSKDDKNLSIYTDYEFFGENPPFDYHPSKKCHRIIADSIIEKIRFIEKNTLTNPYL